MPAGKVVARHPDMVALALALPLFALTGLPLGGYALGAGVWLAQKAMQLYFESRLRRADNPRAVVGLVAGGAIARAWLAAIAVLAIGIMAGDEVGLAGVLMVLGLFSIYFARRIFERIVSPPAGASQ